VVLSDCAFSTERASLRILGLLRDYATMGLTLSFIGGPCHPLVTFLPQQWIEMSFKDYWMIRVANLAAAIEVRGYAPSVAVDTVINVRDPLLPANDGTWRMSVAGGRGHLERHDGPPAFSTDIRTFASIYAGFLSPIQAILFGRATGSATAAAALGGAFAGTAPWMVDHF
jgi:predicted acetyltransferase